MPVVDLATNYSNGAYSPTITNKSQINSGNSYLYADSTNGILYKFTVPTANNDGTGLSWYQGKNANSASFTIGSSVTEPKTLYIRAVCDLSHMKTVYVDATKWTGMDTFEVMNGDISRTYFNITASFQVSPNLFRLVLPDDEIVQLHKGSNYISYALNLSESGTSNYVFITSTGASSGKVWCSTKATTTSGTATISVAGVNKATMDLGDCVNSNYFVYEHGVVGEYNEVLAITIAGTSYEGLSNKTYNATDYHSYNAGAANKGLPSYLKVNGSNQIQVNVNGGARFNFYVTTSGKISIVMVPKLGNGYYIMNTGDNGGGTDGFIGGKKMSSGSESNASYSGFYATTSTSIYIRSYINAVDTLYKNRGTICAGASLNTTTGVITFSTAGYYNIFVENGNISIESFAVNDFFKLNPLDTNKADTASNIKDQKTSLVLEVQFTCNNPFSSKISLGVDNNTDYIGVSLYCTSERLADPYNTMRGNSIYGTLLNGNRIADQNDLTITANSGENVYYAYILVDYLPGDLYDDFASEFSTASLAFYLTSTQA